MLDSIEELQKKHANRVGIKQQAYNHLAIYDNFESNPAYRVVEVNDQKQGVHFLTKFREYGEPQVYCITKPDEPLNVGDYVYSNGDIWLCHTYDAFPVPKYFLEQCNRTLRWHDGNKIHEYPCILSDKTSVYSDGISRNRHIALYSNQLLVTVPNNAQTNSLEHGKRIIFNHDKRQVYKISRIDTLPRRGLIDIRLRRDQYDKSADNLELGVADYYESNKKEMEISLDGEDYVFTDTIELYEVVEDVNTNIELNIHNNDSANAKIIEQGNGWIEVYTGLKEGSFTVVATSDDRVVGEMIVDVVVF